MTKSQHSRPDDMKAPGNLFVIPKDKIRSDDSKDRPLPLMTDMRTLRFGTAIYASTRPTHRLAGAEAVAISGRPTDDPPGFDSDTLVFPGLLYAIEHDALRARVGCLTASEHRAIIEKVAIGIGCGQGSVKQEDGSFGSGLRGMVMRFTEAWTNQVQWQYAIVLTPSPYVLKGYAFHLTVPLLINSRRIEAPNVELAAAEWHERVRMTEQPVMRVGAAVQMASCVKLEHLAGAVPGAVCTTAEVEAIEAGLLAMLGCPPRATERGAEGTDTVR